MNTAPISLLIGAFGLFALVYVLEDKGAVLSTAASAMALVINGAR
ncbi:hypothetical protein [Ancylobacter polymorphus]|uniref:Uncharacterized protein n=1 Tax=Ancylobacter polymorphus TaxID=223390 RepID=A0ABU0BHG5_9HYPH|nr:hypothetical protein [Ancylobacter polymorphus]MDQ0305282.1 hypothetical protein [Ancylobacter polymorphus]